jgi:hypothetical protein
MRIKITLAATLAVLFAVAGVTLAAADSSRSGDGHAQVIKVFSVTAQFAFIDTDKSGADPTLGDEFVFSDDLFDRKGGTKLGTDGVVCTIVRLQPATAPTEASLQCQATISLAGGQITVQGLFTTPTADNSFPPPFDLAVTGGTGDFEGASGHITVEELNETDSNLTVFLTSDDD